MPHKRILVVSHHKRDQIILREILSPEWHVMEAHNTTQAMKILSGTEVPVAIVEANLPDGDWRLLSKLTTTLPHKLQPILVVTSRLADNRLWSEVLNEGGYDVLAQPFIREEVVRVTELAEYHKNGFKKAHQQGM